MLLMNVSLKAFILKFKTDLNCQSNSHITATSFIHMCMCIHIDLYTHT